MKFLHISDLHFGKRLENISLIDDQLYIVQQILNIIKSKSIDAILVAGDIYDRSIPPIEAVTLFDYTLKQFFDLNIPIYMVSGNHDSVERLSFGSSILKSSNIYISNRYDGSIQKETLSDEFGEIDIYLMPYINTINVRASNSIEVDNLSDAFKFIVENSNIDVSKRNILVAHQFVMSTPSEVEYFEEYLGGTQNVEASIFANTFDYTALGHIHKPYWVIKDKVKYCGSPLKYHIDDTSNKCVTILDMKEKGNISFEEVPLIPKRDLRCIKGNLKDILDNAISTNDYVSVTLTDEDYIIGAMDKVRNVYPNVVKLSFENSRTQYADISKTSAENVEDKSVLELFKDFYSDIYGRDLQENPEYMKILNDVFNSLQE